MKTKTEKVLVHSHLVEIERVKTQTGELLPLLQTVVDQAKKIELELTTENFYNAITSPGEFAKAKNIAAIVSEQNKPEFAGRKMKVEAIYDTFEFPSSSQFEQACNELMSNLKTGVISTDVLSIENGKAKIDETEIQKLIDSYCIFATTEKEINLWNEQNKFVEQINKFNSFLKENYGLDEGINQNNFSQYICKKEAGKFAPQLAQFLSLTGR